MATFPTNIQSPSYSLVKVPTFDTNILSYGNKVEQRIAKWANPRYKFRLRWNSLTWSDKKIILDFYLARQGSYDSFYWANSEEVANADQWQVDTIYSLGDIVIPTTTNSHSYKCTDAGTSSPSVEPSWNATEGSVTIDLSPVEWTENSYTVRFEVDTLNIELFEYNLYNFNEITFLEVSA